MIFNFLFLFLTSFLFNSFSGDNNKLLEQLYETEYLDDCIIYNQHLSRLSEIIEKIDINQKEENNESIKNNLIKIKELFKNRIMENILENPTNLEAYLKICLIASKNKEDYNLEDDGYFIEDEEIKNLLKILKNKNDVDDSKLLKSLFDNIEFCEDLKNNL